MTDRLAHAYQFEEQLRAGEAGERFLDRFFAAYWNVRISRATPAQQRRGIDRTFKFPDGRHVTFEYKTDTRAITSGNAFVETVSVDTAGKQGWAYTCQADQIAYYVGGAVGRIYLIEPGYLHEALPFWEADYPLITIPNDGYRTKGLIVPLTELETVSTVIQL